jgi:hypothetical protein
MESKRIAGNIIINTMKTLYLPRLDANGNILRDVAFAALLPDPWNKDVKWPWIMCVHGMGERSDGTEAQLRNLVDGIDFDKDGRVDWVFITADMRRAVDQYGIVMIVPTYQGFFEPDKINKLYNSVVSEYSLVPKMLGDGFSLGAGAWIKYAASSISNASKLAYATPVAPTREVSDLSIIAKSGVPFHIFVNERDDNPATNLSVAKAIVSDINKNTPLIPAVYTAFDVGGHGGYGESNSMTPPKAPNGEGLVDASENKYQVYLDILKNGARQMKTGSVSQPTPTPVPVGVIAKTRYELVGSNLKLIGSGSTGYRDGLEGVWEFVSGPAGVSVYQVFPGGSSYIDADAKLPMPGTYVFKFTLKGATPQTVTVVYAQKSVSYFDSNTDNITFSDGTIEKGIATLSNGKWSIKTLSGKIYEF